MRLIGSKANVKPERVPIAKNQNTFAKMQREMEKKRKAQDKRNRREARKAMAETVPPSHHESHGVDSDEEAEGSPDEPSGDDTSSAGS